MYENGLPELRYVHKPAFIRLFQSEIFELLKTDSFAADGIIERLDAEWKEKVLTAEKERRKRVQSSGTVSRNLAECYQAILHSKNLELYVWIQQNLLKAFKDDWQLAEMLQNRPPEPEFDTFFTEPFKLDIFSSCLDPVEWAKHAESLQVEVYRDILTRQNGVNERIQKMNENLRAFRSGKKDDNGVPIRAHFGFSKLTSDYIIRSMMFSNPGNVNNVERNWYWDLVYICYQGGVGNRTCLPILQDNIIKKMDDYISKLTVRVDDFAAANPEDMVKEDELVYEFRKQSQYRPAYEVFPDENVDIETGLELRSYQVELARSANEGENTVICAPTGAGKTIVAADIIKQHLERRKFDKFGIEQEISRVVFIVPTVPLVGQQVKQVKKFLQHRWIVTGFSGADGFDNAASRFDSLMKSHVVIITPQLLLNMMKSILKSERLLVSDFSLVVFDECHHCTAKHPYKIIMEYIVDSPSALKPQIVGLTASLGIGGNDARDDENATKHILRMCVAMKATNLSTVKSPENVQELNEYVSPPVDEVTKCKRPDQDRFNEYMREILFHFFDFLEPFVKEYSLSIIEQQPKIYDKLRNFAFSRRSSMSWEKQLDLLREVFITVEDVDKRMFVNLALTHVKVYMFAMKMNDLVQAVYANGYLKTEILALEKNTNTDNQTFLKFYKDREMEINHAANTDNGAGKEILVKLIENLAKAYTEKPDTQCLIFVERRAMTRYLVDFLLRSPSMKKLMQNQSNFARNLTSSNQSSKYGGMSSAEQKNIIKKFAEGKIKILVVTSVAEEGLDISACNLVIKYNSVGSERTMIQRRGRARAKGSKTILLALDEAIETRETQNMMKEAMLKRVISQLQHQGDAALKRMIKEEDSKLQAMKDIQDEERRKLREQLSHKKYKIKCGNCTKQISDTTKIRLAVETYYVGVNADIWSRLKVSDDDSSAKDAYVIKCGTAVCNMTSNCSHRLGEIIKFGEVYYPAFKSTQLIFEEEKSYGECETRRGQPWNKLVEHFNVSNLSERDQIEMINALQSSFETYKLVKGNELVAIRKQREAMKRKREKKLHDFFDDIDMYYQ
ncbi:unnamed protein product [Bursaphelenchus okinawaensis]|uniref:RNA helicase n=1 Tax=Bursaphelenchus okinawaensis TaxID=465554 RepID=A0A811K2M8_9BILA|nr:unnamed protein product [Bursaphelenchus okinawaensis]CAG9090828.1 unnamed protein product [Bursaphelenchus okinawaensis]